MELVQVKTSKIPFLVGEILEIVKNQELSNPAIIVLGEVVNHRAILANVQEEYAKALID